MTYRTWTIRLEAQSPFLIGGHRIENNHFETLDYIPGLTLQAAFARAILESHAVYDVDRHGKERRYFIEENHPEVKAEDCREVWKPWFRTFSRLCFSDATPFGSRRYTPTTFGCKTNAEHDTVESLGQQYKQRTGEQIDIQPLQCRICVNAKDPNGGRMERRDGWVKDGTSVSIQPRLVTRVQLDAQRIVASDERLYSLTVGEPYARDKKTQGQVPVYFEAILYAPEEAGDLTIKEERIHAGAYITSGLGKMKVSVSAREQSPSQNDIDRIIKSWRNAVGDESVALQFLSDVPFTGADGVTDALTYRETDKYLSDYTTWLQEKSNLPQEVSVTFAYLQQQQRRGFMKGGRLQREPHIQTFFQNGSLLVFKGKQDVLKKWVENCCREGMPLHDETDTFAYRIPVRPVEV